MIFVYRSKRGGRVKLLVCDGTGLVLILKRLESAKWPPNQPSRSPRSEPTPKHCEVDPSSETTGAGLLVGSAAAPTC
jgi:hypothetical protein